MNEYHFRTAGNLCVCFRTAHDLSHDKNALLQFGAYIPGFEMMDQTSVPPDIVLEHIKGPKNKLESSGNKLALLSSDTNGIPADVYHLLYAAVRKVLLSQRNICIVHSACVGIKDQFRLVVGHSGSGKTTLAQRLIDRHGMTLFSGNKTALRFESDGTITAVAGTRTMTALDDNMNRYTYELKPEDYAENCEVKITSIDIIRVNDGVEECQSLSPLSALHTLYPYFMDQVNADVIVCGSHIFDGNVAVAAKQKIVDGLGASLRQTPVRKISGTMDYMESSIGNSQKLLPET
ncbi:MAG: hypothetical protein LRZ85_00720 [Alphaproteobacteria bacterium]|nr:hypothetical protein [Alphaproteobacteria bacterium]MCD8525966.1 hypothetical protein [Alphaproteobacteria bacterium]MCD8570904.1 hypothetical protein [Alphaproteobacteria bacterium]